MLADWEEIFDTMTIYVNGDSWSWARNLYSEDLWSNILAKRLNTTCINESTGCGSNSRIVDCLRNQFLMGFRPELVVIALTSHHRCHVPAPDFGAWSIGPAVALNDRTGQTNQQIVNWIFSHSYSEIDSIYRYYRDIWTIDLLCKSFSCPYLLIQAWDETLEDLSLLKSNENIEKYVYNQCADKTIHLENYCKSFEVFKESSKNWNYIETALTKCLDPAQDFDHTGHPNQQGHHKMAEKIYQSLQEMKII